MTYNRGKLTKHSLLMKSPSLIGALPRTCAMTEKNFYSMLDRFQSVIVKPSGGSGGVGVTSLTALGGQKVKLHYGRTIKIIDGRRSAYAFMKSRMQGKSHIVQRKIPLAKVKGKPFDIRVMVQRRKKASWEITGKLAKVAGSGYIITNVARSKGKVVPLSQAIRESNIHGGGVSGILKRVDQTALRAAKQLHKYYSLRTVGLDIGLDAGGKVWIIEANFTPSKALFNKLEDKTMYRRIISEAYLN